MAGKGNLISASTRISGLRARVRPVATQGNTQAVALPKLRVPETRPDAEVMAGGMMPHSVVAFADALGTKASSNSDTASLTFLVRLREATERVSQRLKRIGPLYKINVRWFSDSIAMSVPFEKSSHFVDLLENLAYVQAGYALEGILLRGAVTTGPHHHSEYIDYGPALTEAVQLERVLAGATTRIVLSPMLQHDLSTFGANFLPVVEDLEDHSYFLDFIGSLDRATRPMLRKQIDANYREAQISKNEAVIRKLAWLASYYNWRTRPPKPLSWAPDHDFRKVFSPEGETSC
jgi:hypothetical protein